MTQKTAINVIVAFVVFFSSVFWLKGQQSSSLLSVLSMPTESPAWFLIANSTEVTITVQLPYASLIPNGVNLIQLNSIGGAVILGQLHDDGRNGDVVAGDGIYSIRLPFSASGPEVLQLQVSAAFRGALRRITSPVFVLSAYSAPPTLPPDPGSAGLATIAGIDSDHDGVRDDVQRFIALSYPSSEKLRAALTQEAVALQDAITYGSASPLSETTWLQVSYASDCLTATLMTSASDVIGGQNVIAVSNSLLAQVLNTPDRAKAYFLWDSGIGPTFDVSVPYAQKAQGCLVNPSTLSN